MSAVITQKGTPLTSAQRAAIVAEARTWVRTPYHHCADKKGLGVDCAMILVRIYTGLKIAPPFDPRPYAPQWYLHQGEEKYLGWIRQYCDQVEPGEEQPGDIAMYKFGRCVAHGTIIVDANYMIHAFEPDRQVSLTERTAPYMVDRFHSFWSPRNFS